MYPIDFWKTVIGWSWTKKDFISRKLCANHVFKKDMMIHLRKRKLKNNYSLKWILDILQKKFKKWLFNWVKEISTRIYAERSWSFRCVEMKWCTVEYVTKLSLISRNPSNINHELRVETLINPFCRKFILNEMLLCTRKLRASFVIEMKLSLLTKNYRLRETFALFEFCPFVRKWSKSGISRLFEGMTTNGRSAKKWKWKNIRSLHIETESIGRPIGVFSIFTTLQQVYLD